MAFHISVFAVTGDPVVQRLLPELVAAVMERAPGTKALDCSDGVASAGCDLVTPGHDGAIRLEVNTHPGTVKSMVDWGLLFDGSEGLVADTLLTLILVGDIDWRVVRALCEVAVHRWSGVICAEGSESVASLADLP